MPGATLLPLASELDALLWWEAARIECGDMKAEAAVVWWLVHRIAPAATTPVEFGGAMRPQAWCRYEIPGLADAEPQYG